MKQKLDNVLFLWSDRAVSQSKGGADMGEIRQRNVCLRSLLYLRDACKGAGVDEKEFLREILERFKTTDEAELKNTWVTLAEWTGIEQWWMEKAGHPDYLMRAGMFSGKRAFGLEKKGALVLLSRFLSFFTTPTLAVLQIPAGNKTHNTTKIFRVVEASANGATLEIDYANDGGRSIHPAEDRGSLAYFMPGFMMTFAPLWSPAVSFLAGQDPFSPHYKPGFMRFRLVMLDPYKHMLAMAPEYDFAVNEQGLSFNGERCGIMVYLRENNQYSIEPIAGAPRAILLTKDVLTEVKGARGAGIWKPIMRMGDLYLCDPDRHPRLRTRIELRWSVNPLSWFIMTCIVLPLWRSTRFALGMTRSVEEEEERAALHGQLAQVEAERDDERELIKGGFPTREFAELVRRREFGERTMEAFVLCADRVKSSMSPPDTPTLQGSYAIVEGLSGWILKQMGDCIIAMWSLDWPCGADETIPLKTKEECARAAYEGAEELHDYFGKRGWKMRIGVVYGKIKLLQVYKLLAGGQRVYKAEVDVENTATIQNAKSAEDGLRYDEIPKRDEQGKIVLDSDGDPVLLKEERADGGAGRTRIESEVMAFLAQEIEIDDGAIQPESPVAAIPRERSRRRVHGRTSVLSIKGGRKSKVVTLEPKR